MVQRLYSDSLPLYTKEIVNDKLKVSLQKLVELIGHELVLKEWPTGKLAVLLELSISLPQFGSKVGISEIEPIIIVFDEVSYPFAAPSVYPDRLGFPFGNLGHLYVAVDDRPAQFCLVRGNLNEWYSGKLIEDLLIRVKNWLSDAATGELNKDGEQFEPLRLEGYSGSLTFDYDVFCEICKNKRSYEYAGNFAKLLFERTPSEKGTLCWKFLEEVSQSEIVKKLELIVENAVKKDEAPEKKYIYFGYLVWSEQSLPDDGYDVNLPTDWGGLKRYCLQYKIDLGLLEKELVESKKLRPYASVPVIVAIKRSKNIIGFGADIEFVNFHVRLLDDKIVDGIISDNAVVKFKQHKQPLTANKAGEISGTSKITELTLVAGCGALGSRVVLHFAKSGYTDMLLSDDDILMPHNFVRHPLSVKYTNRNKALALAEEVKEIYNQSKSNIHGFKFSAEKVISILEGKEPWKRILDFTASLAFAQLLASGKNMVPVIRGFISDFGKLGIIMVEGSGRNPRIDDLQMLLYRQAICSTEISNWLQNEAAATEKIKDVTVGLGCNSETTVLSEENIALHAAFMSRILRSNLERSIAESGSVYINQLNEKPELPPVFNHFVFKKLEVFKAVNDPSWEIRFANGVVESLSEQMKANFPKETGGVFVGACNFKTRTIHVVDLVDAPIDSKANEVCFFRGVDGLPEAIDKLNEITGNQLGYVGEWHSHPQGPNVLSPTDMRAVDSFKTGYTSQSNPLPVFLTIITPDGIFPFIF